MLPAAGNYEGFSKAFNCLRRQSPNKPANSDDGIWSNQRPLALSLGDSSVHQKAEFVAQQMCLYHSYSKVFPWALALLFNMDEHFKD